MLYNYNISNQSVIYSLQGMDEKVTSPLITDCITDMTLFSRKQCSAICVTKTTIDRPRYAMTLCLKLLSQD